MLCLSLLVVVVDGSIVNVALPTLVRHLHASTSALQWVVDAYTLAVAGLLLSLGSLGDRIGRHRTLAGGLIVFGLGSVLAAMSTSASDSSPARVVMGIGAAAIMPATLSILTNVFTVPVERAKAIAMWSAVAGLGVVDRPDARWMAPRALRLGLDLHGEPAHRRRGARRRTAGRPAFGEPSPAGPRPGRRPAVDRRHRRRRLRHHRRSHRMAG